MTRPSAAVRNRRNQLLARTALAGLGVAVVMTATPALAQVTGVGTITGTTSNGGAVGVFTGPGSTDISTGASRSIVNWTTLNVTSTEQLRFFFNNHQDIVLNRVAGSASIDGILSGCVSTCATPGGNIWILSAGGVVIGANAQISTGGFLAGVGDVTNADFLDGDMNFAFTGPDEGTISVAGGASINTAGGSIALIAPTINTQAGSTVSAGGAGNVLYGSATNYNVTFAATADNDLDLISFQVPAAADGAGGLYGGSITLGGATTGNRVYAAVVSKAGLTSTLLATGDITATSVGTDETGAIVLSNNRSIVGGAVSAPVPAAGTGTVTNHGVLTAPSVTLAAAGALLFSDDINAAGGSVSLSSDTGTVHQNDGEITANTLTASAATDIVLAAGFDGDVNNVAQLAGLTSTGGGISYTGGSYQITGAIYAPGVVGLSSTGTISGAGQISAGSISLSGQGAVNVLGNANLLYSASTGNLTIHATGGIAMTDGWDLNGHTLNLIADAGSIVQTGDAIYDGGTLITTATGDIDFGSQSNYVTTFGGNSSGGGDIAFRGNGTFAVGATSTTGQLSLTSDGGHITSPGGINVGSLTASAAGSMTLDGAIASVDDVTAGGFVTLNSYSTAMDLTGDITGTTVTLYADTGVTQSGGKIDTGRLNVITTGAISLTGANEIDVVGRLDSDQFSSGTGGDITLRNVGNIVLDYLVTAPGATVSFTSDTGAITQTGLGTITANRLIASAAGDITLYDGVNDVATIGGLSSTNGDIVYRDIDSFDIQGNITANAPFRGVMLVAGGAGAITQTSGVLDVGYFRGIAGGSITLGGANLIRRLISTQASNGSLTLNTTTDLSIEGTVAVGFGAVSLTSAGAITQANNAQIWTSTLNASAVTGINLTASGSGANNIANLGTIANTTSGGVTVSNAMNFNLTGNITASGQAVSITNTQGSISQTGGIITADSLSLSATTGITATRNNVVGNLGAVTAGGNFAFTNAGNLYLTDNINVGADTVSLTSNTGQIEQTTGVITAGSLNLQTGGRIWLNNANAVSSLGTVTAGGHILFRNAGNTVVGGDITANGFDVTLRSNSGSVTQTAGSDIVSNSMQLIAQTGAVLTNAGNSINEIAWVDVSSGGFAFSQSGGFQIGGPVMIANGGTVSLTSLSGAITQTSGFITTAGTLNLSAAGAIDLDGSFNNVGSLGTVTSGGAFLYQDVTGFTLTGNITAANQVELTANNGGAIQQTGGIITAASIDAVAEGDLLLGGANQITTVTNLDAGANLLYRQVGDLAAPTINATGTVSLYSTTGDITQTGTITADTLVLGAGDDIILGQNFITKLGQIDAGGDFTAADANGLSVGALGLTGNITVGGAMTLVNPGAIFQTSSTAITAGSLFIDTDGALSATGANSISGNTRLSATDAVFNAVGDLTLQVNVTGFATIVSDGAVEIGGVGASTGDTLNIQAANGISQTQTLTFTNFGNLTNTTAGGIDLTNSSWLYLTGAINAANQYVALNVVNGGIQQMSGSTITANRLGVTTTQGANLYEMNNVAELGDVNTGAHNFVFRTWGDLLIDGDVTSGLNMNLTSATGGISQTAGSDIKANALFVMAETGISLTNAGNDVDKLGTMINLGSSGGIAYAQTDGFQIDSVVRALNQTVSLTSVAGGISETGTAFAQIEAGTLNISAGGAVTLHRDNDVNNLGVISAVGGFTFNDVDGFNLTGNVTGGGAVVLDAVNGSIVQSGGVITATSIDAAASGNLDLGSANVVGAVTALTAGGDILYRQVGNLSVPAITATGSLSLYSTTGSIGQTGPLSAATLNLGAVTGILLGNAGNDIGALGNVSNTTSGQINFLNSDGFDLTGAITAGGSQFVSLNALSGAITQQAGGSITAQVLSLVAWSGATLGGDNDVDALGIVVGGPSFVFNDIDDLDISGALNAQTADLTAGGAITQSGGNLNVGTLSLTAASVALDGANNITTLGAVDVAGNMSFSDVDGITLDGVQAVDGTLSLTAATFVTQQGGGLDVGRLEIDAGTAVNINQTANDIGALGDISSTSGSIAIIKNAFGPLQIDGDISAAASGQTIYINGFASGLTMTAAGSLTAGANIDLVAGGNIVLGDINAGGTLNILAAGSSVSSLAAPTIVAARLTGTATAGSIVLSGANIDIDQIGNIEVGNTFSITGNNGQLELAGVIVAQTVSLGTTGDLTQLGGNVDATTGSFSAGGALTMAANNGVDTVSLNGASVAYTGSGSFAANVVTSTGAVSLISTTGKITQTALTGKIVADSLTASAATGLEFFGGQNDIRLLAGLSSTSGGVTYRDMGGFEITGNINATGQTVELVSDGTGADGTDVTQSGGVITANRLQGTSAGDLLFSGANAVGQLGYLNAGGNIRFRGAASFTLQDNVTAGGGVILNADTGSIQQFGGTIVADAFAGTAAAGISLSRVNDVDFLGAVDSGAGDFTFRDGDSFDIAGLITSDTGMVLQAGGSINQTSGSIVTGTLSLFTDGGAFLNGVGNDIDTLGLSTVMNGMLFIDVDGFDISDRIFSTALVSLGAVTGDIVEVAGGYVSANGLSVYASAGEVDLSGDNVIGSVGDLVAGGDLTFHEVDGFTMSGNITGDTIELTVAAGAITQTGGAITGDSLLVSAVTGIGLTQAGNDVDTIAGLTTTSGGISYTDADSVNIAGAVTASGQTVTFNVGGDLTQLGAGVITANRVQGSAGGAFALADQANVVAQLGPVTAGSIDLVTIDTGLTIVGALDATGGVTLKADDFITQTTGSTITGTTLRLLADGDITLAEANDVDSITLLYSDLGDITYADVDGFSLDGSSIGDFWTSGTFTLTAGGTGGITQSGAGLRAGTLLITAGGDITLDQANRIDVLGDSSAGGSVFRVVNLGDLEVAGDISVAGALGDLDLSSQTGKVEQTSGEIDAYTVGGASAGDFILTDFTGALGDITTTAGDIDITNAGDVILFGLLHTDNTDSVTLTSTAGMIGHGVGRIETGTLNLDAAISIALDGAQSNDVARLGTVSTYSNFAFRNDDGFQLIGDIDVSMIGGGVVLTATNGGIAQGGGVITAYGLTLQTLGGLNLSGANMVDQLTVTNGSNVGVTFVNAKALNVLGVTSDGNVALATTAGLLTVSGGITTDGEINLAGAGGVLATGALDTTGDVTVTAATGDIDLYNVVVGDDLAVTASDGDAQVRNLTLTGSSDSESDGGNGFIYASHDAFLGARNEAGIASQTVNRAGGVGEITVASTGDGDAGVFLQNANTTISLSAGTDGTATYVLGSGDLQAGNVSGTNVVLKANAGIVNAGSVILGGGDYTLYGRDFSSGAFGFIGAARDITITDTLGLLELTGSLFANRNLTITAVGSVLDGTGSVSLLAGLDADDTGVLTVTAADITLTGAGADGDVSLTATSGNVNVGTVGVSGDYTLSGAGFSVGALSPVGATAGTWSITDTGGFDFTGLTLTYNGDIEIQAGDDITGGNVQSITGSVSIGGPTAIDIENLYAATDITVTTTGALTLDSATAYGGDITLSGRSSATVEGFAEAGGNVTVTSNNGTVDVNAATAGGNITVQTSSGDAILGAASLTGATGDLTIMATGGGDVIFGVLDYTTVSTDNVFSRAAGSTGTVTLLSATGDVTANLWSSARLDLVQAFIDAEVSTETGDLEIGQIQSVGGEIYAEAVDGDLTIGEASAPQGFLGLYAGGNLTILDGAYGYAGVEIEVGGLLDARLATTLASRGDMVLTGGSVLLNRVSADGDLAIGAVGTDGDVSIEFAETNGFLSIGSLDGDVTLRAADAFDGIELFAFGNVTLGADTAGLIINQNYISVSGGGCGCGPGDITVVSAEGDVTVNLDRVTGVFDAIGAAIDGDVNIVIQSGNLSIADLAGYNITVDVLNGTLETGYGDPSLYGVFLSGGNYSVTANGFLGNALTPNLPFGSMNDYTVIQRGSPALDMTGIQVVAQGDIVVTSASGNVVGDAQLTAVGDVTVMGIGIQLGSVEGENVSLLAGVGTVNVATGVTVDESYTLTGGDFSLAALTPLGLKAGDLSITDTVGTFDFAALNLVYGGDITIRAGGLATVGDITSQAGDIDIQSNMGVIADALSATSGKIDVYGYGASGVTVASATANDHIYIYTSGGAARLGAAALLGTGSNYLNVFASTTGPAVLGAANAGAITGLHTFTSAGSTTEASVQSTSGTATVNLYSAQGPLNVYAASDVAVTVLDGDLQLASANSANGRIDIDGPNGQLTIGALNAFADVDITGVDIALNDALVGGALTVDATGDIAFDGPAGSLFGAIKVTGGVTLVAGGGISQNTDAEIRANNLTVNAADGVSLLGANQIIELQNITVGAGGFSYRGVNAFGYHLAGTIDAAGQTVDLRSDGGSIRQTGGTIIAQRLTGASGDDAAFISANRIAELGDFGADGAFVLNVDQALTIVGTVDSLAGTLIHSDGMTIASTGTVRSSGVGDAVILGSNGVFTNNSGADAVQAANGRWLIYTQAFNDPTGSTAGDNYGGLGGKSYYGTNYNFAGSFSGPINSGNRFVHAYQPILTVTPNTQTVTYSGQIPTLTATILGLINGDLAADAWSGQAAFTGATGKNVGTYNITAALGSLLSDLNYGFTFGTGVLTIDPKALTGTINANDKTYDGNTDATGTIVLTGVIAGDDVSANAGSYAFGDRNAGVGKTVTAYGVALAGADAGNYTLDPLATAIADILRKALTGNLTASGKTYDGTAATTGSVTLTGVIGGDDVTATGGTFAFADKNAGFGKTVTASGVGLTGADAANYDLSAVSTALADILRKAITGTLTANTRTYDGTTTTGGSISLTGLIAGDDVTAGGTYSFADKTAGAGKTVTASGVTLSGIDGDNYDLTAVSTAIADILRKSLSGTVVAANKTYDGTATASGSISLTGVVAGDDVSADGTYAFGDKNAGLGKTVTASGVALSGADAANYDLSAVSAAIADILRKSLVGTITASNKTYDGTTTATGSVSVTGMIAGDDVSATGGTFAFADKNAGLGKAVTGTGVALAGADAANYELDPLAAAVADILRKTITATVAVNNKTYDGTTTGTGTVTLNGVIAGDAVTGGGTYTFADANAGVGKTVTVAGVSLSGTDAANYDLTAPSSTAIADILRRQIAIRANDAFKLFGQLDPAFTFTITSGSLVGGDSFTGSLTRDIGDTYGDYAITQGTVMLSSNYELLFTPGVFSIRPIPGGGQDGGAAFLYLRTPKGMGLDWDPSENLTDCPDDIDCPAETGGQAEIDSGSKGLAVAMLGWRRFLPGAIGGKASVD